VIFSLHHPIPRSPGNIAIAVAVCLSQRKKSSFQILK